MIKLAIAIPCYTTQVDMGHCGMWLGLGAALAASADKIQLVSMNEYVINGVDLARNTAVYDALQTDASWCLMSDADTYFRSQVDGDNADAIADNGVAIIQMIRDAERKQIPVWNEATQQHALVPIQLPYNNGVGLIGAPVRARSARVVGAAGPCVQDVMGVPMTMDILAGKVQPVGRIGAAFIAVHLTWLREYWPIGPWFVMEHDYSARPKNARGEDYFICDGIWKRGGAVVCDGRFVPSHVDRRRLVGEET